MTQRIDTEVAIIGGGIVGGSAALFLRRQGVPVVVLEAALCGARASGVNYGGVRRQGRGLEQMPLARRAHELWGRLPELIGIDGEYVRSGHLKLAASEADMALLEAYRERTRGFGMHLDMLDRRTLAKRFGWLGQDVAGASFCPEDGHANPRLVSPAFGRAASALGADVREGVRVTSAEYDGSRFVLRADNGLEVRSRYLLNCAGAWAGRFAEGFGEAVPETSIHPLMMVTEPLPVFMTVSLGIQGGGIYARQVSRGNCVIGGGRGVSTDPDFARPGRANLSALMANATTLLPVLRGAQVIRFWTGVEGNMPDHNPVLGPSSTVPGLFHAFGLSGAGFQIGPAVGEVLSELVVNGQSPIPIDAFRIERYTAAAHGAVALPESVREQTLESP
ncbi:NAD(P)/FAD-dependent oxidoreductase [Achromobacter pestifer]|uniref:Glycine oxidase n=1 Tax=Achromobacter pestifer TaxID=1353889 RepID=A0A6S6Z7J0_9BURK|nr:FAD-binding oxidoreductase [Achromobacter pestifer]CAB3666243.1 Glycine oxidase [Achromobacter pestifer]